MAMSESVPPRFRKTKTGKWAVMAPIETLEKALAAGGKVDVQKKSGDWSSFVVASLGRPFDVDGVQMCYGYGPDDDGDDGTGAAPSHSGARQTGPATQAPPDRRPPSPTPQPPAPDEYEPLPEYQGSSEDEWHGDF